jgi:hypothetical protein
MEKNSTILHRNDALTDRDAWLQRFIEFFKIHESYAVGNGASQYAIMVWVRVFTNGSVLPIHVRCHDPFFSGFRLPLDFLSMTIPPFLMEGLTASPSYHPCKIAMRL